IDKKRKEKVAYFCNMTADEVISNPDLPSIYQLPLELAAQDFDKKALEKLELSAGRRDLGEWKKMVEEVLRSEGKKVVIGVIAGHIKSGDFELQDSYASLLEALKHAAYFNKAKLDIRFITTEDLEENINNLDKVFVGIEGIVVPTGWGAHGVGGKVGVTHWIRENKTPCLAIGWAQNVMDLTKTKVRRGGYDCVLQKGSRVAKIYMKHDAFKDKDKLLITERHRQNHELDNIYRKSLEEAGLVVSGTSPNGELVEMIELPENEHPFFVAMAACPQYKSAPLKPHPLFVEFIKATLKA
ncbi:hypothetical protein FWH30_02415, partial [Microgenomates group bacterium]|nr:hypothetical protein [Microgenomates group bacterium]